MSWQKTLAAAATLVAMLPGVAVFVRGLHTPPGWELLFAGMLEFFGIVTVLMLARSRRTIAKWSSRKAAKTIAVCIAIGLVVLVVHLVLYTTYVVALEGRETAVFPLWFSGQVEEMVGTGTPVDAVLKYGAGAINEAAKKTPLPLILTIIVLLLTYVPAPTLFAAVLAIGAIRAEQKKPGRPGTTSTAPPPASGQSP